VASIDEIVKQAQVDGYLRISSSRGLAAREDAEEPYYFWCKARRRPCVTIVDLRTRFAEVAVEMFLDDVPGSEAIDRKYYRRIAALFDKESVLRLSAREKKQKVPDFLRFGFIRWGYAVSCRIPKTRAARVARALLKIGTDWTQELARTSHPTDNTTNIATRSQEEHGAVQA
jgi:hypothetical protein